MKSVYQKPDLRLSEMELENFVCASITTLPIFVEVDEYQTFDEEVLTF